MSYTQTPNLNLRKDNGDEKIVDMRPHLNTNLDTIDQAYGDLDSRCRGQQTWGNLKSTTTWGELKGNGVTTPSSQTTNLQLIKPGYDSNVDVEVFNDNMDIIDTSIKTLQDSVTWQTGSFTLASGVAVYGCDIRKANGMLLVYLNIGFSGSYTAQKTVGTLSVGFRPSGPWVFPVGNLDVNADSRDDRYAQVNPDGTVVVVGPGRRMFVNGWMSL